MSFKKNNLWNPFQDNAETKEDMNPLQDNADHNPMEDNADSTKPYEERLDIEYMTKCQEILAYLPDSKQTEPYVKVMEHIAKYLEENCPHEFVSDYIDITPDYGCNIRFCERCGTVAPAGINH